MTENGSRRKFLGRACAAAGTGMCGLAAYPVIDYLIPRPGFKASGPLDVAASSVVPEGSGITVRLPGWTILVIRHGGKLSAMDAECTHLGCIVEWDLPAGRVKCNCHGGLFTPEGKRIDGPPPKDQPSLPVKEENGRIIVTF